MKKTVSIIGLGKLGTSLASFFHNSDLKYGTKALNVIGSFGQRTPEKLLRLNAALGDNVKLFNSNKYTALKADYLFLTIKPNIVEEVAKEINDFLNEKTVIISAVAGVKMNTLKSYFPHNKDIIRCMPNILCSTEESIVTFYSDFYSSPFIMHHLFWPNSVIRLYSDKAIDSSTLIAGCGPALISHYYQMVKSYHYDLPDSAVTKIVNHMLIATGKLLQEKSAQNIIDEVSSTGGVTEKILQSCHIRRQIHSALEEGINHLNKNIK